MKYFQSVYNLSPRLKAWFFLGLFGLGLGCQLLLPFRPAQAVETGKWVDKGTILVGTTPFRDDNVFNDGDGDYLYKSNDTDCLGEINIPKKNMESNNGGSDGTYYQKVRNSGNECLWKVNNDRGQSAVTISLQNSGSRFVNAYQVDINTIFMPNYFTREQNGLGHENKPQQDGVFKRLANDISTCVNDNSKKISRSDGPDKDHCVIFDLYAGGANGGLVQQVWIDTSENKFHADCGCTAVDGSGDQKDLVFANNRVFTTPPAEAGYKLDKSKDAAAANTTASPSCESNNTDISTNWLICGIINALDSAVNSAATIVNDLLDVNSEDFTSGKSGDQIKTVWSVFRAIASFSLLAVALVMIIGQNLGGGE